MPEELLTIGKIEENKGYITYVSYEPLICAEWDPNEELVKHTLVADYENNDFQVLSTRFKGKIYEHSDETYTNLQEAEQAYSKLLAERGLDYHPTQLKRAINQLGVGGSIDTKLNRETQTFEEE